MFKDIIEIDNFLSADEFDLLKKFSIKLISQDTTSNTNGTIGFVYEKSIIKKLIDNKLKRVLKPFHVHQSMVLNEVSPWAIHTDWHKGDKNPYCAVLLPIDFDDKDTHTIVFNEIGYDDDWKSTQEPKNTTWSARELELLSHISESTRDLVTLKKTMKWESRKLIVWDRKLLHCSDNFIKETVKKTALVLFLSEYEEV